MSVLTLSAPPPSHCPPHLATIRVLATVGHGQQPRSCVLSVKVLVFKAITVNGGRASTIALKQVWVECRLLSLAVMRGLVEARVCYLEEVATLDHKVLDDSVELAVLVPNGNASLSVHWSDTSTHMSQTLLLLLVL